MRLLSRHKKPIALLLLFVMGIEIMMPTAAYALTSGPAQPEMKGFEPIGNSDMVDVSSGDFSYNIPLMTVGDYPINLSYHSGAGMDEEASWVGYGWGLNVGSLNRNLRGLPDDFNGSDKMEREMSMKDHITKGGKFSMTLDLLGIPINKYKTAKKKRKLNLSLTVSIGISHDNYRGIGMEIGANPGVSLTDYVAGEYTQSHEDSATNSTGIGGLDLSLSSFGGAGIKVNSKILSKKLLYEDKTSYTQSIGFGYNTRGGGASLTVDLFKDPTLKFGEKLLKKNLQVGSFINSLLDFSGDTYTPTVDHPTKTESYNLSLHLGPELWVAFPGIGVSGFYTKQKVAERLRSAPAYGFLNSEKGKDNVDAVMDFNREKDIPYSKKVKYIAIPVPTYDLFSANSQDGAGQYRLYRGSSGVFFDPKTETTTDNFSVGIEVGAGTYFDVGADLYKQDINTVTRKWTARNNYLAKGDFQGASSSDIAYEPAYFKRVGEPVPYDNNYVAKIKGTSPVAVSLPARIEDVVAGAKADDKLRTKTSRNGEAISVLKRDKREVRNTTFSYLTAREAANHGMDKTILDIKPDSIYISGCSSTGSIKSTINRVGGVRKAHHFSEVIVTGDDGKRSVFGIPVYNTKQEEVSFSSKQNLSLRNKGLINYTAQDNSTGNKNGRENYFSKETTPPYATSYLLTGILSPDYTDRTGDGITDDDNGTAVKFNYTKLNSLYKWRTPYAYGADTANYNEGLLSDANDDKANFVYGEKEVWYLHSVESKTMVAHFITEDRDDGLGVTGNNGAKDMSSRLKRLKEIRLYSKSDLRLHGNNPALTTPIKVVHLEYNYSVCRNLPNSANGAGKLTLSRVYFTFGKNQKGKLNPYDFKYDTTQYNEYGYRQYDRWGTFKDAANNPNGLNNSEFPYTLQDTTYTNKFVRAWQLNEIKLPSGGSIRISYESDDYAWVQDRRASQMCTVNGVGAPNQNTGLINADYIYVNLPYACANSQEMRERYFEGITNLYYKFFLDLDAKGHSEFVPGYAEIDPSVKPDLAPGYNNVARIKLKKMKGVNPIAKDGWQFIRTSLPKYAYPGSDNLDDPGSDLKKAIKALVTAFGTIKELFRGFDKRAKNKGYSNNVNISKSWVRLCAPTWKKLGGGSRVRRIDMSDDWATMSGAAGAQTSTFSQVYDYTTKDGKGRTISSGVASYEPMLGNDENPFRQPIRYNQREFLGLNNFYYIEEPFGESFFPGASVVYSKVTVKSIGTGDAETVNRTGTIVNEFYTAKDYPVKVDILGLEHRKPITSKLFKLIGAVNFDMVGLSQGFSVETNDMHGKPKSTQVFNKSGQKISSVEYFYKSVNELTARKELKNDVKVINPDGTVSDGTIGMDVEMYSDMRQQVTENLGISLKISGGSGAILIFPLPFFFPGIGVNYDRRNYRSTSTIKIINRFAIQYKVTKMENGSTITSENLAWDAETGNVLLTKSQNEFDDPVYSFAYPAHWKYDGMAQAYKNLGTVFSQFSSNSSGEIINAAYNAMLAPGDELIDIQNSNKYWVINTPVSNVYKKRIINAGGAIQNITNRTLKILRSGRRNMANTAIATISSLKNPVVSNVLNVSAVTQILDAKATVFSEVWSVPVNASTGNTSLPTGCGISIGCMDKFIKATMKYNPNIGKSAFYQTNTGMSSPINSYQIMHDVNMYYPGDTSCFGNFFNGQPATAVQFYQYNVSGSYPNANVSSGDSAAFGNCKMYFDLVTPLFNQLANTIVHDSDFAYDPKCPAKAIQIYEDPNVPCGFMVLGLALLRQSFKEGDCNSIDTLMKFHIACPPTINTGCLDPVGDTINPYYTGVLGNWRAKSSYVYQVNRENLDSDPTKKGSTDIRKSGAYSVFSPFWTYSGNSWNQSTDIKWIAANEVSYFNQKGLELENKDALNRYSAAQFGYLESMPVAVASNTQYREIAFDGFEDYGFNLSCAPADTCNNSGHFNFRKALNGSSIDTTSAASHTGKYSLKVNSNTATLVKTVFTTSPGAIFTFDNAGQYKLGSNELTKGFSPIPGKKYVLSFWVKDDSPRSPTTTLQPKVNGVTLINSSQTWPVVEGWKRVETQFVLPALATNFTLQFKADAEVFIDDIRLFPVDGQMKTFAYDASSQRLMAELDENNFATFYEYDDEGILIRVKKETERGIMTIKETRSSYRKRL